MIRKLARLAGVAALVAALAACGVDTGQTDQAEAEPAVEAPAEEPVDVADFLGHDDETDGIDCEADDKAKKEIPDCGFYAGPSNTTFYWWSWVRAGKAEPPAGWSATREVEPYRTPSRAVKPAASPAKKATTKPVARPTGAGARKR